MLLLVVELCEDGEGGGTPVTLLVVSAGMSIYATRRQGALPGFYRYTNPTVIEFRDG